MLHQRNPAVEGVALDEQEVLFHQTTNKFVLVNPAGRFLWELLAEPRSPAVLAAALCRRFPDAAPAEAQEHAARFVARLDERDFVATSAGDTDPPDATDATDAPNGTAMPYHAPDLRDVTEEEVLASFQMTAAEISAASCWWFNCATGCP